MTGTPPVALTMEIPETPEHLSPPDLARLAIETYVGAAQTIAPPARLIGVLAQRAGAFVTLRTRDGELRGCMGTIEPMLPTLAEEVIHNAISAATRDPRFQPVDASELALLTYGVDVLSLLETVCGPEDLDPARYGVIIETIRGGQRSLLLPAIAGIATVEEQWRAVHHKIGVPLGAPVSVRRFTVTRYGMKD